MKKHTFVLCANLAIKIQTRNSILMSPNNVLLSNTQVSIVEIMRNMVDLLLGELQ